MYLRIFNHNTQPFATHNRLRVKLVKQPHRQVRARTPHELRLEQHPFHLSAHLLHFRVLQNVRQPLIREPDLAAETIPQSFHLTAPFTMPFSVAKETETHIIAAKDTEFAFRLPHSAFWRSRTPSPGGEGRGEGD